MAWDMNIDWKLGAQPLRIGDTIGNLPGDYRKAQAQKLELQTAQENAARQRAIYDAFKGGIPLNAAGEPDIDKAITMIAPNNPDAALKLAIDRENAKATLLYRQAQLANAGAKNIPKGYEPNPDKPGEIRRMPGYTVPMTPTLQNNITKADDALLAGQQADSLLREAEKVNPEAYSNVPGKNNELAAGLSAWELPVVGNPLNKFVPGLNKKAGQATLNLKNIVTNQAVSQLKAAFGGQPSEGERKILIEIQGSIDQPAEVRADIFSRARKLLAARQKLNLSRSKGLRTGEYLAPGGGPQDAEAIDLSGDGGGDTGGAIPFDPSMTEEDMVPDQQYSFPDGSIHVWDGETNTFEQQPDQPPPEDQ